MAKQITLAMTYPNDPMHPGQNPRLLQRCDRHADTISVTFCDCSDLLVAREAAAAAIGAMEAPEERAQHAQRRPGQRTLVLVLLPIRRIVSRSRGPDAGFGVAVETM